MPPAVWFHGPEEVYESSVGPLLHSPSDMSGTNDSEADETGTPGSEELYDREVSASELGRYTSRG